MLNILSAADRQTVYVQVWIMLWCLHPQTAELQFTHHN